jgi:hypothetical protein
MTSINNWGHSHSNINANQIRTPKEMTAINMQPKVTPQSSFIPRQRISNFVPNVSSMAPSTTSTPVNQTMNNLIITHNHNINDNKNKIHSQMNNQDLQQSHKLDFPMAQKRTVITFRVIDQIVDDSGKVLKETVIKDEEIIKNLGKVEWNESITPSSTISSVSRFASNTNSGDLADVSSSLKSNLSSALLLENTHNQTNESLTKGHSKSDDFFNKIPTPIVRNTPINTTFPEETSDLNRKLDLDIKSPIITPKRNSENVTVISGKKQQTVVTNRDIEDEEERRETATALLSLQTQRGLNIDCNSSDQMSSKNISLRPGVRVMAKWRDKSFYPAIISKYISQNNKWSVIFEDKATRNLFDTEIIQTEHLVEGQDVMVSISEGFCAKATIKSVIDDGNESIFEVEQLKDDIKILKQYSLKDLFLNQEQGQNIALKCAKPVLNGAVFADVDLDNIVSGKRARITKQDNTEKTVQNFKNIRRRPAEAVSIDVDYVNDDDDDEDDTFPTKSKKKAISVRVNKKKFESQTTNFHSEHSLSISPRTTKTSISMPPQELIKLLGPLPESGSNIFKGVSFLLTCGDRNKSEDLCLEQSNPERSTPFDKLYLIKQIETGSGKVFETFEDMKVRRMLLI